LKTVYNYKKGMILLVKKDDHFEEARGSRKSASDSWVPEKNVATGFTIKGMIMFLSLIGLFIVIRYLFF
jgi:hypothetical protein